jgi:hypothetical protein
MEEADSARCFVELPCRHGNLMPPFLSEILTSHKVEEMEKYAVLFVIVVSFLIPRLASSQFAAVERAFGRLARRRTLAWVAVGILALIARAAVLPLLPVPIPSIQDEYENLLMADTFSHGRITNPPHPMRIHFETFHVLQEPTYTGIVPPAQGLALAAGKIIGGHPFVGVWLSVGIMCAAICWMLQGWLPPGWALFGGLLAVMRFGVSSYWANSYWGGAIAAAAGAIVLGAFPRIRKHQRIVDVMLMGLGLAILANSRPYEGFVLCLPVGAAMLIWVAASRGARLREVLRGVVLPLALLLCITAGGIGYYNLRVTGNPLRSPYVVSMATVNPVPYFIWQSLRPIPAYHYKMIRDLYLEWDLPQYEKARSFRGWVESSTSKIKRLSTFYLGAALGFPVIVAVLIGGFRSVFLGRLRFLLLCLGISLAGLLVEVQYIPHYAAPLTAIILVFVVQSTRYVYLCSQRRKSRFLFAMRAVPLICVLSLSIGMAQLSLGYDIVTDWPHSWYSPMVGNNERADILKWLEQQPGQHLVIVRYSPKHSVHDEWVYNLSDIDGAKVVWARDMDSDHNQELIHYFQDRTVWLVEPDKRQNREVQAVPYPGSSATLQSVAVEAGSSRMY